MPTPDLDPVGDAPYGPRPAGPRADPATQMSRARAAVLEHLARHVEPTTVGTLAAECGQHTNTVREHLDALASAGLVVRSTGQARGRGRPAIRYAAVPPESVRPQMRQYVNLVSALSEQIGRAVPDPRGFAVDAGRLVPQQDGDVTMSGGNAADASLRLLADLGFDPQVAGADGPDAPADQGGPVDAAAPGGATGVEVPAASTAAAPGGPGADPADDPRDSSGRPVLTVRLRECPLLEAARRNPEVVCAVHLGAILGAYEARGESTDGIAVIPFAEPGACIAHLPVTPTAEDSPA